MISESNKPANLAKRHILTTKQLKYSYLQIRFDLLLTPSPELLANSSAALSFRLGTFLEVRSNGYNPSPRLNWIGVSKMKAERTHVLLTPRAGFLGCDIWRQSCAQFRICTVNGIIKEIAQDRHLPSRNMALQICPEIAGIECLCEFYQLPVYFWDSYQYLQH